MTTQVNKFEIGIHDDGKTGWFEHDKYGEDMGGGLWFDFDGTLYDYDGVYELPLEVAEGIKKLGFTHDEEDLTYFDKKDKNE